jgi:Ca2+-transporting ATPase
LYALKTSQDAVLARSVAFAAVGFNSLLYVFSVKTLRVPFWKDGVFNNKWLNLAVLGGFVLQYVPFSFAGLREFFQVTLIGWYWFPVIGIAFLLFLIVEASKLLMGERINYNQ